MTQDNAHDTHDRHSPTPGHAPARPREPLPGYVMAGIAKLMIGEALRPDGIRVSVGEAMRWLDVLNSTEPPTT